jgi:ketosteroid isomerase-like protein
VTDNVGAVRTFLDLLERGDIDTWLDLWAEDAEQYYPFGTEMFPHHIVGRAAIHERWRDMPAMFTSLRFPVRETWVDGDTVVTRFDGECVLRDGTTYANHYLGIFKFDAAGRIREYWEYFDPIVAGVGFGLATVDYRMAGAS